MSTVACIDYRRTDQRTNVLENPYWITSGLINCAALTVKDKGLLLFSFPHAGRVVILHDIVVQNVAAITAATTLVIGFGTIATDAAVTGDNITYSANDGIMATGSEVLTIATVWGPAAGSTWVTAAAAAAYSTSRRLLGAATACPVIFAVMSNAGTITVGSLRIHILVSEIPGT
jgi:hypothetical protein